MVKEEGVRLTCRQCSKEFILTKAEQEFYELKGFNLPSRCKECRTSRQIKAQPLACSQCNTELVKGTSIYCANCLQTAHFELEKENKQIKMAISAAKQMILKALEFHGSNLSEAARSLGLSRGALYRRLEKHHISV